jgi:CBS-domain-containing membrane protein
MNRLRAPGHAFLLSLALLSAVALAGLLLRQPLLFPSLGPTVMLFVDSPEQEAAAPRNTLVGHGVAVLAGAGCLHAFGLAGHPTVLQEGVTGPRIAAAALSVALTVGILRLISRPHPPAGATTLIVSLGLLTTVPQLLAVGAAVVLTTVLAVALNRLLGVHQPLWSPVGDR